MKRLVNIIIAERTVVAIIILNTLALMVQGYTDPALAPPTEVQTATESLVFLVASNVDFGCVIYFVIELALKMRIQRWKAFWDSGWNIFDFVVVVASLPVLLSPFLDVGDFGVFLVLRLGRLFRLFRVMRFIPNREKIYEGIKRSLKASVGVFLALTLINLVLSLGATQLFGRYAPQLFGDPGMSMYSLFRVFTVEGWYEIPDAIAATAPPAVALLARLYFMMCVMVGGILGLSLANAVFVDEMTIDNTRELEEKVDVLLVEMKAVRTQLTKDG